MCHSDSVDSKKYGNITTHKVEGRAQVLVVPFPITSVKLFRFSTVYSKKVCSKAIGLSGSGISLRAGWRLSSRAVCQQFPDYYGQMGLAHHSESIWKAVGCSC